MDGPVISTAFNMGIISACSLPLGALTALCWKPGDRVAAALVAFGGGALLAALTLGLVVPAFERGHYAWLENGCMAGGLLFVALNEIINDYGGFLRKTSTTIYHQRRQEHRRFTRILSNLQRIDIFQNLPPEDFKRTADAIRSRHYEKGASLYQPGDSPDVLYVIADGEVELRDPQRGMEQRMRECVKNRGVARYAETRQDFDSSRALRSVHTAIRDLDTGWLIPAAEEMAARLRTIKGAPLAIWLGPGKSVFCGGRRTRLVPDQGIAAGAMPTMIVQTMLPDACFKGGLVIGLATLTGLLAALFFESV